MAITVVNPPTTGLAGPQSHGAMLNLKGTTLYRWSLIVGADNDTFDTGLKGIVEIAIAGTRSVTTYAAPQSLAFASGDCAIVSVSNAGVVTFSVAGSTLLDLLVWASN